MQWTVARTAKHSGLEPSSGLRLDGHEHAGSGVLASVPDAWADGPPQAESAATQATVAAKTPRTLPIGSQDTARAGQADHERPRTMYARTVGELVLHRRCALLAFCAAMAIACEFSRHHAGHEAVAELVAVSALLFWCTLDARIHDKTFHHGWGVPFMATWPVALPIYLVWTRGWRRGSKVCGVILGVWFALGIVLVVAGVVPIPPR
jgi:hypothetical protein